MAYKSRKQYRKSYKKISKRRTRSRRGGTGTVTYMNLCTSCGKGIPQGSTKCKTCQEIINSLEKKNKRNCNCETCKKNAPNHIFQLFQFKCIAVKLK